MKRYDIVPDYNATFETEECADGDWVRYEDATNLEKALRDLLEWIAFTPPKQCYGRGLHALVAQAQGALGMHAPRQVMAMPAPEPCEIEQVPSLRQQMNLPVSVNDHQVVWEARLRGLLKPSAAQLGGE